MKNNSKKEQNKHNQFAAWFISIIQTFRVIKMWFNYIGKNNKEELTGSFQLIMSKIKIHKNSINRIWNEKVSYRRTLERFEIGLQERMITEGLC